MRQIDHIIPSYNRDAYRFNTGASTAFNGQAYTIVDNQAYSMTSANTTPYNKEILIFTVL